MGFSADKEAGTTLIEMMVAVGILGIIAGFSAQGFRNYQKAMARRDAASDAVQQISLAGSRTMKYWNQRARPPLSVDSTYTSYNASNPYTAAQPGFVIISPSAFYVILGYDANGNMTSWLMLQTVCKAVSKTSLQSLNFNAASSCVSCGVGQAPALYIQSSNVTNNPNYQFPPPGNAGATKSSLSMSACVQPWAFNPNPGNPIQPPLAVQFQAATLDPGGNLSVISKVMDFPFDNATGADVTQSQ